MSVLNKIDSSNTSTKWASDCRLQKKQMLVLVREGTDEKYELHAGKDAFQIGRQVSCDIRFRSVYVSRQHCEIKRIPPDGRLILSNNKPTTITYVDDLELKGEHAICGLQVGSRIGLGVPLNQADESGLRNPDFVFLCVKEEIPAVIDLLEDNDEPEDVQPSRELQGNSSKNKNDRNITPEHWEESGKNRENSLQEHRLHLSNSSTDIHTGDKPQKGYEQENLPLQLESPALSKHKPEVQCQGISTKAQSQKQDDMILSLTHEKSSSISQTPSSDKVRHSVLRLSVEDEPSASLNEVTGNNSTRDLSDEKCTVDSKSPVNDLNGNKCKDFIEESDPVDSVYSLKKSKLLVPRTSFDENISSEAHFSCKGSEVPENVTEVSSRVNVGHGNSLRVQDHQSPTVASLIQEKYSFKKLPSSCEAEVEPFFNGVQMENEKEGENANKIESLLGNCSFTEEECEAAISVRSKEEEKVGKRKQYSNEGEDHGKIRCERKKTKLSLTKEKNECIQSNSSTNKNICSSDFETKEVDIHVAEHESNASNQDELTVKKNTENMASIKRDSMESAKNLLSGEKLKVSEMNMESNSEELIIRSSAAKKRMTYIDSESDSGNVESDREKLIIQSTGAKKKMTRIESENDSDSSDCIQMKRKRAIQIKSDSEDGSDNSQNIHRPKNAKKLRIENEKHIDRKVDDSKKSTSYGIKLTEGKPCSVLLEVLPKDVINASIKNTTEIADDIEKRSPEFVHLSSDDEMFIKDDAKLFESNDCIKTSTPRQDIASKCTSRQELLKGCTSKQKVKKCSLKQEKFKNSPKVKESEIAVSEEETSKPTTRHKEKEPYRHKKKGVKLSDQAGEVGESEQEFVSGLQCEHLSDHKSGKQFQRREIENRSVCHNKGSRSLGDIDITNEKETSKNSSEVSPVAVMTEKETELNIKEEPEERPSRKMVGIYDDDDDLEILYSQTSETIYISSDDEELLPNLSDIDRHSPARASPELSIEDILEKESGFTEIKKEEEDEEEWFPVLSQAFMDEMYGNESTADDDENRIEEDQPKPSVSGVSSKKNDISFSMGDSSDEELLNLESYFTNKKEPNKTLKKLTDKLKTKYEPNKSKLTEPKCPPRRNKNDTLKVRGSQERAEKKKNENKKKEDRVSKGATPKVTAETSRRVSPALPKTSRKSRSRKGSGDLRENLTKTFNLGSYQTSLAQKSREKHHLRSEENDKKSEAPKQGNSKSESDHLAQNDLKASAKNSVSNERLSKESKDSPDPQKKKMTGIAKVTVKTRNRSLMDVNLFAPPSIPPAQKHRIPKKNPVTKKNNPASPKTTTPLVDRPSAQPGNKTQSAEPPDAKVTTENKIQSKSKKKVHFPPDNDLVQVRPISPRPEKLKNPALPRNTKELYRHPVEGLSLELCLYSFVSKVCSWNYDWLTKYCAHKAEYEKRGKSQLVKPPPVNGTDPTFPTLILYDSYQDYKDIFSNLLFYEMWESLYSDWTQKGSANGWLSSQVDAIRYFEYEINGQKHRLWSCRICILCTQDMLRDSPRIGCLIVLKKRMRNDAKGKNLNIMGYVDSCERRPARNLTKELVSTCKDATVCLVTTALIAKPAIMEFNLGDLVLVKNISYIRPNLRNYEGLCMLQTSTLCSHILSPATYVFSCDVTIPDFVSSKINLNESQKRAIVEVSSKCLINPQMPKISLIQGPPGTGKTRTIAGLVVQIIEACKSNNIRNYRILLCAPSNTAVDEVTLRLLKLREVGINLRLVRTGLSASVSAEVKDCTLDQLVEKNAKREMDNKSVHLEVERTKKLVNEAAECLLKKHKAGAPEDEIHSCETRLNELVRHQRDLEKQAEVFPSSKSQNWMQCKQKWTQQVLLNAEVITTTLTSCVSGAMAEVFSHNSPVFTCCIVDEAGQCKETDTWLPLLLKVRKIVLVGDHKQLPATVLSYLAQNKRLHQSLFERLHHHLSLELQRNDLIHLLDVQYRMHPEIVQWPSQHFYSNAIKTFPAIIPQRSYAIKPYVIFDLQDSKEQQFASGELCNPDEVCLVVKLLEALTSNNYMKGLKIAVITPYQCQRKDLEKMISKFRPQHDISVSTVDSCQGKEKDVVILSFVRANTTGNIGFVAQRQRLNVALTRARMSCFLIANLRSFEKNEDWAALIANARERKAVAELKKSNTTDINYLMRNLLR